MKCTPQRIHELTEQARRGSHEATVELCYCFMPLILATSPKQRQADIVQEVCISLIQEINAQKLH